MIPMKTFNTNNNMNSRRLEDGSDAIIKGKRATARFALASAEQRRRFYMYHIEIF